MELTSRNGLPNFYSKLKAGKPLSIAFLGGSITRAGNGYRDQIMTWFKSQYPQNQFTEIMAAVSGTGSDYGACRVREHVINHRPDLVFVEFAVNDNRWLMRFVRETMEGIVRQIWQSNPETDICFIYTFSAENLPQLQAGKFPTSASAMETIADFYGIPSIHMGLAVVDQLQEGKIVMTGKRDQPSALPIFSYDGVHPLAETGHVIYTQVLSKSLLRLQDRGVAGLHALKAPLEAGNWSDAGMVGRSAARFKGAWHVTDSVTKGKEYLSLMPDVQSTSSPDAVLKVKFKGERFGLADIMGPSTANIEVQIDKQPVRVINRFDAFSTYYRLNYFILSGLGKGKHKATVRLSSQPIDKAAILKTRNVEVKDFKPYEGKTLYVGAILY